LNNANEPVLLHPYVRFINASENDGVDFYVFNSPISTNAACGYAGEYVKCARGLTNFRVCKNDTVLASMAFNAEPGVVHTICAVGSEDNVSLYAIDENADKTTPEYGHLRICNLFNNDKTIDIYANEKCFASDVGYLAVTRYIEMVPDLYELKIRHHNNQNILAGYGKQSIKCRKYNTLFVLPPNDNNSSPNCIFTIDSGSYSGFYL